MSNTIKLGLSFELHKKRYTLLSFRGGVPLITCEETGQVQRISDQTLEKLLKGGVKKKNF